jgi:hypothetical protein
MAKSPRTLEGRASKYFASAHPSSPSVLVEKVMRAHLSYLSTRGYGPSATDVCVDGVRARVYAVGHNASHEFYLGWTEDGLFVKYSAGEGELDENDTPKLDVRMVRADQNDFGYLGHC